MDEVKEIAVIKNKSERNIFVVHSDNSISDNQILYGNKFLVSSNMSRIFFDGSSVIGNDTCIYF